MYFFSSPPPPPLPFCDGIQLLVKLSNVFLEPLVTMVCLELQSLPSYWWSWTRRKCNGSRSASNCTPSTSLTTPPPLSTPPPSPPQYTSHRPHLSHILNNPLFSMPITEHAMDSNVYVCVCVCVCIWLFKVQQIFPLGINLNGILLSFLWRLCLCYRIVTVLVMCTVTSSPRMAC